MLRLTAVHTRWCTVPTEAGLGTHATLDVEGNLKFGPDSEWIEWDPSRTPPPYEVDPSRGEVFYSEIRKYWPGLRDGKLKAAYSGLRPKDRKSVV